MSRILYGMNGISDEFISEAAEYRRHGSRGLYLRLAAAAACVLLTVSVAGALTVGRQPGSDRLPQTPASVIFPLGDTKTCRFGTIEYRAYDERTVTLGMKADYPGGTYWFQIEAYVPVGVDGADVYHFITPDHPMCGAEKWLTGMLRIYIDGEPSETVCLEGDGKMHEIVIDFGEVIDEGYLIGPVPIWAMECFYER